MDLESLQPLFEWIKANPTWAGLMVFLIAMSESLLVIGLIVPGAVMMFGVGALVGAGALGFWETILWAFIGAIAGDGISFWIGYFFSDRVENIWPFKKKPELLKKAQDFFLKHGGKSILFGRFVGPVRPVIPAVAGMMKMSPWKFTLVNVVSAVGWAPAYLIPGIVFGTSLGLASQVTSRLALLIVVLIAAVWITYIVIRRTVLFVEPRAEAWLKRSFEWSLRHPHIGRFTKQILDPDFSPTGALLWWALLLVVLIVSLVFMLRRMLGTVEGPLSDRSIFHFFQDLRFSALDNVMVFVYQLGDSFVLTTIVGLLIFWCWRSAHNRVLLYWSIAYSVGMLALLFINSLLAVPRPFDFAGPGLDSNFPSWHSTMPIITFGFLSVLLAEGLSANARWLLYSFAALLSFSISMAGLILGAHWASDVVVGFCFGLLWLVIVSMALRRRVHKQPNKTRLSIIFLSTLILVQVINVSIYFTKDRSKYLYEVPTHTLSLQSWLGGEWKNVMPPFRQDMFGRTKQPLTLQWATGLDGLSQVFVGQGWRLVEPMDFADSVKLFAPDISLEQTPVLPNLHDGQEEVAIFAKAIDGVSEIVIRFWPSNYQIESKYPVYVGNISIHYKQANGLLVVRKTEEKELTLNQVLPDLQKRHTIKQVHFDLAEYNLQSHRDDRVWLVY